MIRVSDIMEKEIINVKMEKDGVYNRHRHGYSRR